MCFNSFRSFIKNLLSAGLRRKVRRIIKPVQDRIELKKSPDKVKKRFNQYCTSEESKLAAKSFRQLRRGDITRALKTFERALEKIFDDELRRSYWSEAYRAVAGLYSGQIYEAQVNIGNHMIRQHPEEESGHHATQRNSKLKKVFTSGMGWSGSGAVADFIREFNDVSYRIGEIGHIERGVSLKVLRGTSGEFKIFRDNVLEFFAMNLFGYGVYRTHTELKCLRRARKALWFNENTDYSEGAYLFCKQLNHAYTQGELDYEKFDNAANILLDKLAEAYCFGDESVALFDNSLSIKSIEELDYIRNGILFATFRDPRSTYVNRIKVYSKRNPSRIQKVGEFISKYRKQIQKAKAKIQKLQKNNRPVYQVQFEEFILDTSLREKIADMVGLDMQKRDKHNHFRSWESEKNVFNYTSYHDQESIRRIEEELPEYLWSN